LFYIDDGTSEWPPAIGYFAHVKKAAVVTRKRGPLTIETFAIDVVSSPKSDVIDPLPPELRSKT
jgi:hypothetical protein